MTATTITPELLKTQPFLWDAAKHTAPPQRRVCVDAIRPAVWGNAVLAASAALRCGSPVSVLATGHELGALALALPECTFHTEAGAAGNAVACFLEVPEATPPQGAVIVCANPAALHQGCIGVTAQSLENVSTPQGLLAGGWPGLKVLSADGVFEPEARPAKDGPQPFVPGGEFVLAGIISALLARGLPAQAAGMWSLYLFHLAIEAAAKDLGSEGVRASDLIARLPGSLRYATRHADAKNAAYAGLRPV